MLTTLSPFAIMLFPEDPFGRGSLDLYTNYLRRLEVKQKGDISTDTKRGKNRDLTKEKLGYSFFNTEITLEVFDPDFYVLESYFVNNAKSSDLWFGWVDAEGKIHNDYKISVRILKIQPKITPTGNALMIELVCDPAAQRGPVSMLTKVISQSKTFISGGLKAKLAEDKAIREARRQYEKSDGTRRGPLPQQARGTYYYERISDVVAFVCAEAGLESDIDVTPIVKPAPSGSATWFEFRMVNQTAMSFLEDLARYASNADFLTGDSGNEYHVWVDNTGKVFFKSSKVRKEAPKKPYTLNYLADNHTNIEDYINRVDPKGGIPTIIVDLDIDINVGVFAEAISSVKSVSVDPVSKTFKGANIAATSPVDKKQAKKILGLDDVRNTTIEGTNLQRSALNAASLNQSKALRENKIVVANSNDDMNWFIYEDAQTLIDNPDPKYTNQLKASQVATTGSLSGGVDAGSAASKYAQYVTQLNELGDAATPPQDAQNAIGQSDLDKVESDKQNIEPSDATLTGVMNVLPYHDDRTARHAASIYADALDTALVVTATIFGDTSIKLQDTCNVYINLPKTYRSNENGPTLHFASGEYAVIQVSHIVDQNGFTTQVAMKRDATTIKENKDGESSNLTDPSNSGTVDRSADASIGAGGEGNLPTKDGGETSTNVVSLGPTAGGAGLTEASTGSFTVVSDDVLDLYNIDISQLSPIKSAYSNQQANNYIYPDGPNINRTNAALFDPGGAFTDKSNRRIDIFSLPGNKTKPKVDS
jgi:hypothetical protein